MSGNLPQARVERLAVQRRLEAKLLHEDFLERARAWEQRVRSGEDWKVAANVVGLRIAAARSLLMHPTIRAGLLPSETARTAEIRAETRDQAGRPLRTTMAEIVAARDQDVDDYEDNDDAARPPGPWPDAPAGPFATSWEASDRPDDRNQRWFTDPNLRSPCGFVEPSVRNAGDAYQAAREPRPVRRRFRSLRRV